MPTKEIVKQVFILLVLFIAFCYSVWQIVVRVQNNFAGIETIIPIFVLSLIGLILNRPRKKK
ncbi:hypothetical protein J6TS2_08820 [Heyndrickxia sporothermodurans]|nr:hypothetical protein J6TS2_08820 [Heyndrickxia sporothermodurans]